MYDAYTPILGDYGFSTKFEEILEEEPICGTLGYLTHEALDIHFNHKSTKYWKNDTADTFAVV